MGSGALEKQRDFSDVIKFWGIKDILIIIKNLLIGELNCIRVFLELDFILLYTCFKNLDQTFRKYIFKQI